MLNNKRAITMSVAVGLMIGSGGPFSAAAAQQAASPAPQDGGNDGAVLAWIRFEKVEKTYAQIPYLWLGDVNINLDIDVKPSPDHALYLRWGSKRDARQAVVTINGQDSTVTHGGYDGFEWVRVPMPANVSGSKYEITLSRSSATAAFVAEVRLIGRGAGPGKPSGDFSKPAFKISGNSGPASPPEAFPEIRRFWDTEPEPPANPLADAERETAFRQAERNARRAAEQLFRCRRFVDGWLAQSDPTTGLIPRNLTRDRDIWNAKDSAADNYPFMVLTSALTDRKLFEGRMLEMLRTETRLTCRVDRLPDTWSFSKQAFQTEEANLESVIFGGSEYVKDGLLPLTEWLGPSPWCERMLGIVDDIWKNAEVETPFGKIASTNVEVNGELLQALSRIYWMTGDEKYLDWAVRLGDYYLLGENHPTRDFSSLRLRDHGCEIVSGLSELYATVSFARPEKKKAYQKPIHQMIDRILEIGRNEHGMLYNTINPQTGEHPNGFCDTWGYNYNGVYVAYLIDGTEAYRQAVRDVLSNLTEHLTEYHWGSADEYADSIEGAVNLYNREPVESATTWIDTEIRDMWSNQQPDGVVEGWHGDGNSARTAIMYALWKTRGLTLQPWRADVRVGAVDLDGTLCVSLKADEPYLGKLVFDKPRHQVQMHLPIDYPRINQFPEWFTAKAEKRYTVRKIASKVGDEYSGKRLQEGIEIELAAGEELRLEVATLP